MNRDEKITETLTAIAEVFQYQFSELSLEIYLTMLAPFDLELVLSALNRCVQELKFFPRPAEILERIYNKPDLDSQAVLAYAEFERKVSSKGRICSVTFTDAAIAWTCDFFGGWEAIIEQMGTLTPNQFAFFRREFQQVYKAYTSRGNLRNYRLTGSFERTNRSEGWLGDDDMLMLRSGEKIKPEWLEEKPVDERNRIEQKAKELSNDTQG